MEKGAEKNILFLIGAGIILILANAAIVMGIRSGQVAPFDNQVLWSAFAVLNVCSLLWAVSLLGLQPLVVAVSYVAGGVLAYEGVRLTPGVNVAEIAAAGATYSAFGALLVGNATTKVRMAFFAKKQVPFIFIILGLLLVDGLLNSRISNADWHIISNAVVYPFLLSGVIVGLIWMLMVRIRADRPVRAKKAVAREEAASAASDAAHDEEAAQLMFSVPENAVVDADEMSEEMVPVLESTAEESMQTPMNDWAASDPEIEDDDAGSDTFFPLEIDNSEETLLEENPDLLNVAAMVVDSAVEPDLETELETDPEPSDTFAYNEDPDPELSESFDEMSEVSSLLESVEELEEDEIATDPVEAVDTDPALPDPVEELEEDAISKDPVEAVDSDPALPDPVEEPEEAPETPESEKEASGETDLEDEKAGTGDWLSSHMDLLNKIK